MKAGPKAPTAGEFGVEISAKLCCFQRIRASESNQVKQLDADLRQEADLFIIPLLPFSAQTSDTESAG